jgi:hypothetical protein
MLIGDQGTKALIAFPPADVVDITIPSEIEIIASHCFDGCGNVKRVSFSSSSKLRRIEGKAFADCSGLQRITLPPTLEFIGDRAFEIPGRWLEVDFTGCHSLRRIESGAFQEISSPVCLPASLEFLDPESFLDWSTVTFDPGGRFGMREVGVVSGDDSELFVCLIGPAPQTVFGSGLNLVRIERRAFVRRFGIESILFPASVEVLEESCFEQVTSLEEVDSRLGLVFGELNGTLSWGPLCGRWHFRDALNSFTDRHLLTRSCCELISILGADFGSLIGILLRAVMDGRSFVILDGMFRLLFRRGLKFWGRAVLTGARFCCQSHSRLVHV